MAEEAGKGSKGHRRIELMVQKIADQKQMGGKGGHSGGRMQRKADRAKAR